MGGWRSDCEIIVIEYWVRPAGMSTQVTMGGHRKIGLYS